MRIFALFFLLFSISQVSNGKFLKVNDIRVTDFFNRLESRSSLDGEYTISKDSEVISKGSCEDITISMAVDGKRMLLLFKDLIKNEEVLIQFDTINVKNHKLYIINENRLEVLSFYHKTCFPWSDGCNEEDEWLRSSTRKAKIKTTKDGEISNIILESKRSSTQSLLKSKSHYNFKLECKAKLPEPEIHGP